MMISCGRQPALISISPPCQVEKLDSQLEAHHKPGYLLKWHCFRATDLLAVMHHNYVCKLLVYSNRDSLSRQQGVKTDQSTCTVAAPE